MVVQLHARDLASQTLLFFSVRTLKNWEWTGDETYKVGGSDKEVEAR